MPGFGDSQEMGHRQEMGHQDAGDSKKGGSKKVIGEWLLKFKPISFKMIP